MSSKNGNGRRVLGKDDILGLRAPAPVAVELDEGTVYVRMLMANERDAFEAGNFRYADGKAEVVTDNIRARLVVLCACDERGERLFEDADAGAVGCLPAEAIDRVYQKAQELNGLSARAQQAAEKNSETTGGSASSSTSPAT